MRRRGDTLCLFVASAARKLSTKDYKISRVRREKLVNHRESPNFIPSKIYYDIYETLACRIIYLYFNPSQG